MDLAAKLEVFCPCNPQEAADRAEILRRLRSGEALTRRESSAH